MTDQHPKTPDRLSPTQEALLITALGGMLVLTVAFLLAHVGVFGL